MDVEATDKVELSGVRSVLPMMICFISSFMLLGIVPAVVSAVFNAFG